jgi:hypothetical protein
MKIELLFSVPNIAAIQSSLGKYLDMIESYVFCRRNQNFIGFFEISELPWHWNRNGRSLIHQPTDAVILIIHTVVELTAIESDQVFLLFFVDGVDSIHRQQPLVFFFFSAG